MIRVSGAAHVEGAVCYLYESGVALLSQVTDTLREGPHSLLWRALRIELGCE